MSTTFYIRYDDTQHDEQQPEGSKKQTKAAQRADLLHNNRSAANSLAQTIGAASSSTQEAQVESNASPPPLHKRRSRPQSAAGEPTPPSAPQAGIFRSGPRATRFAAAALLSSLGSRSCCSQQRSSSTACRSRACFSQAACFRFFACFFFREEGKGAGGARKEAARQERDTARVLPRGPRGPRREAPAVPQRGTLRNFWPSCSAGGGSWGL